MVATANSEANRENGTVSTLIIGTEVFNRGDRANSEHFGIITDIEDGIVTIQEIDDANHTYKVDVYIIDGVDEGHCGTRIVTRAAYRVHREAAIAAMTTDYEALIAKETASAKHEVVYPEMGETIPENMTIEATMSHCGGFYLKTACELSGRGIRFAGKTTSGRNLNTYHATKLAFEKLCFDEGHTVVSIALL